MRPPQKMGPEAETPVNEEPADAEPETAPPSTEKETAAPSLATAENSEAPAEEEEGNLPSEGASTTEPRPRSPWEDEVLRFYPGVERRIEGHQEIRLLLPLEFEPPRPQEIARGRAVYRRE